MQEQFNPFPKNVPDYHEGNIEDAPNYYLEQLVIKDHQARMIGRAPGKYDSLIKNLDTASNFSVLSKVIPEVVPPAGAGWFPDVEVPYYFGRIADDIADDDRPLPEGYPSIPDWIDVMKQHVIDGGKHIRKAPTIEFLLKRSIERMQPYRNLDVRHELLRFLDAMRWEHDRRVQRVSLPRQELWQLYQEEFGAPHSIIMAAFRSKNRERDVPELPQIQGRRYAINDMTDDLGRGIINIPREELEAAGISDEEAVAMGANIFRNPDIGLWKEIELATCVEMEDSLRQRPLDLNAKLYIKGLL
jgi:hypothetical protein